MKDKSKIIGDPIKCSFGEHIKNMLPLLKLSTPKSWQEIFDEYNCFDLSEVQHGRPSVNFMDWLEKNYNPPTDKQ